MRTTAILRREVFAAGLAAALGFGAVQAFAAPGDSAKARLFCDEGQCIRYCSGQGMSGHCMDLACVCHPN